MEKQTSHEKNKTKQEVRKDKWKEQRKEQKDKDRDRGRDPHCSNRSFQPSTVSGSILTSFMIKLIHRNNGEVWERGEPRRDITHYISISQELGVSTLRRQGEPGRVLLLHLTTKRDVRPTEIDPSVKSALGRSRRGHSAVWNEPFAMAL